MSPYLRMFNNNNNNRHFGLLSIFILAGLLFCCVEGECDSCKHSPCASSPFQEIPIGSSPPLTLLEDLPTTTRTSKGSPKTTTRLNDEPQQSSSPPPAHHSDDQPLPDHHHHQFSNRPSLSSPGKENKSFTLPSCLITVFIIFATFNKIGIHVQVRKTTSLLIPLILVSFLGSLIGGLVVYKSSYSSTSWETVTLLPSTAEKCSLGVVYLSILFLLFLLPHIVSLEQAALSKLTLLLSCSLIFYQVFGSTVTILHCLLLTSIILPCNNRPLSFISKHVQPSNVFYCMISQESLLSNAVSLIVYHLISGQSNFESSPSQLVAWHSSVIYVFAVGIEGTVLTYVLSCLLFTLTKHCSIYVVCIIEGVALIAMSLFAYFSVHFFHLPPILELTLCGICLRQYVDAILLSGSFMMSTARNGSTKMTSLLKLLACICESAILALALLSIPAKIPTLFFPSSPTWNLAFILLTLFIGINCTSLGLICICWWSSQHHPHQPGLLDHFIVYCSALRGLYAFSLALLLGETDLPQKHIMVTSLFAFIFFAVFVQNLTLKVLQNSLKEQRLANKQELISSEKFKENLLDQIFTGFKDVTDLFGYTILREGFHLYTSVLFRNFLMRDHDVPSSPSDRRIRLLQLVRKLNLRTWLQHVTAYGGASSSANTSTPSLPPPATAAAIGAFACAQASLTLTSSSGSRSSGPSGMPLSSRHSSGHLGRSSVSPRQRRRILHRKVPAMNQPIEFHSKPFVPISAEHERCCGEDSGVMVDDHSEEEEEDEDGNRMTSSSALGACCGSAPCTSVEGTRIADDCRIHHIVDHNAYRPRHKWSKFNKKSSRQSNYAVFHHELCMQLEKLCSNRPSKKDADEDVQRLSCLDRLTRSEVEDYLKNITEENIDDPSSNYLLLTTPKERRDNSASDNFEEEENNLEQLIEDEAGALKDESKDAEFAEDSLGFHYRLPWLDEIQSSSPPHVSPPGETIAEKTLPWKCHPDVTKAPLAEAEAEEVETEQTLAEKTLPWKRQSVREPISAAMSLNVVEDEPRAAEVPSWLNNLLYQRLRESGSPYMSPEDTLTLVQNMTRPSIFSVFPIEKPAQEANERERNPLMKTGRCLPPAPPIAAEVESESISLPPPWESHNSAEYEPLTSPHATNTNIGDKVCSTESMHRLLPPTHHHIIVPLTPGNTNESLSDLESAAAIERGALRSPASAPNFPTHWQMLLPTLRDRRHSTSMTEEQEYEEACLQRVQNWLDNVDPGFDGVVDLDKFEEQPFFLLDDEDQLDDTYDADLEDEDLEETIV